MRHATLIIRAAIECWAAKLLMMMSLRKHPRVAWSLAAAFSLSTVLLSCEEKQDQDSQQESSESKDDSKEDSSKLKKDEGGDDESEDASDSPSDEPDDPEQDSKNASEEESKEDSEDTGDTSEEDSGEEEKEKADPRPWFKFFATSQEGLMELAQDKKNGFGGDLGGLAGADAICAKLAQKSNPGDTKTWRAFLSATQGEDGKPVHAIERVGQGPWHDYNKRLFAENVEGLLPGSDRRPSGADPQLAEMFTDEFGRPISPDTNVVDNHDMLTGSDKNGRLPDRATKAETCNDWTSKDTKLGKPRIGHAWPRSSRSGREWIYDHRAGGCGAGIDTEKKGSNGTPTVGSGGGYGGFYCFAL